MKRGHAKDRNKWYVAEITAEPVAQRLSDEQHAAELAAAYVRGAEMGHKLMQYKLIRAIQEVIDESY